MVIIKNVLGIREQFLNHVSDSGCLITDDNRIVEMAVTLTEGTAKQVLFGF